MKRSPAEPDGAQPVDRESRENLPRQGQRERPSTANSFAPAGASSRPRVFHGFRDGRLRRRAAPPVATFRRPCRGWRHRVPTRDFEWPLCDHRATENPARQSRNQSGPGKQPQIHTDETQIKTRLCLIHLCFIRVNLWLKLPVPFQLVACFSRICASGQTLNR